MSPSAADPAGPAAHPDLWPYCAALSRRAFLAHDAVPWVRARREETYRQRGLTVAAGDGLCTALLALVLRSRVHETRMVTGRDTAPAALAATRLRDAEPHGAGLWSGALYAGLDRDRLGPADRHWVNILELIEYGTFPRAPIVLARLAADVREVLDRLVRRYANEELTFADLPAGPDAAA